MHYSVDIALRDSIIQDGTAERRLETILAVMEDQTFGLRQASKIVGGSTRLTKLMDDGKIRYTKDFEIQNSKYYLNAGDVLRYAKEGYRTRNRVRA